MNYSDKIDYLAIFFGACVLFVFFLFAGGGSLLDKWIDGIREYINKIFDSMPVCGIKTVRFLWYVVYAAIVILIFTHITD